MEVIMLGNNLLFEKFISTAISVIAGCIMSATAMIM
jgi:hypothetical protein